MTSSSFQSIQIAEPLLQYAFCLDNDIEYNKEDVIFQAPSSKTYRRLIPNNAGLTVHQHIELLKSNPYVYVTCDKGSSEKRGQQNSLFPKLLTWYCSATDKIEEMLLDLDRAVSKSSSAAEAVVYSLERLIKLSDYSLHLTIMGVFTDSGGGGTLESLLKEIRDELIGNDFISLHPNATFVGCSLHNLQSCLRNMVRICFDEGVTHEIDNKIVYKKNAMQLMNGLGDVFNYLDLEFIKSIWNTTIIKMNTEKKFKVFKPPTLTRWWTLGVSCDNLSPWWEVWQQVLHNCSKMSQNQIPATVIKIMKSTRELMIIAEIRCDIEFFLAVHNSFIFPHFSFLQKGDPLTKNKPGFQSRLITVCFFLMLQDLNKLKNNCWKSSVSYNNVVKYMTTYIPEATHDKIDRKANNSFRIMIEILEKHFSPWCNRLIVFAIFGEHALANIVLHHLLSLPLVIFEENQIYYSDIQKRNINLKEFQQFIQSFCQNFDIDMLQGLPLTLIIQGYDIWASSNNEHPGIVQLRRFFFTKLCSAGSSTHNAERSVKLAKKCDEKFRSENLNSEYASSSFTHINQCAETCSSIHASYFNSAQKKREINGNDTMRYKTGAIAMINNIEKMSQEELKNFLKDSND